MSKQNGAASSEQKDGTPDLAELRAENARLRAEVEALRAQQAQPAAPKLPEAKPGHVWCYTRYPYVVERYEGGKFKPEAVAAGQPVEVTLKELQIDRMRRFPHLETAEAHDERLAKQRDQQTAPVRERMDNIALMYADTAERIAAREEQVRQRAALLLNPAALAEQLPQ